MQSYENVLMLRTSFKFAIDVMDFHDELIDQKKAPIAKRILKSTLAGLCEMQKAMIADRSSTYREATLAAVINFKNVVYWMQQCEKSGYLFNEILMKKAVEILNYCQVKLPDDAFDAQ